MSSIKLSESESVNNKTSNDTNTASSDSLPKKIVIRRLPPSMSKDQFLEIVSPLPDYDHLYYCNSDLSLGLNAFCRAYIYFRNFDDIINFRDRFDGYVFVDSKSNEYPAVVEFAPFQRKYKNGDSQKKDSKCNTMDQDLDYSTFLKTFDKPQGDPLPSCEAILEEIEQREKDKIANGMNGTDAAFYAPKVITPLLEFLRKRREDKKMSRNQDKDGKKRRDEDRKQIKRRDRDRDNYYNDNQSYKESKNYSDKSQSYGSSSVSQKSSKNKDSSSFSSNFDSSNVKVLSKPQQQQQQQTSKSTTTSLQANLTPKAIESKSFSNQSSKSINQSGSNYGKDNVKDYKSSQNKTNASRGDKSSSTNTSSRTNKYESDNKQNKSQYTEKPQIDKTRDTRYSGASSNLLSSEEKKIVAGDEPEEMRNETAEQKELRALRNKDRPSIEIYNPAQRAALRQKQQKPN